MSRTTAIADGPISFFTSLGQQLFIPIGMIAFNSGVVEIVGADPRYDRDDIKAWLTHLHELGVIREGAAPAPQAAMNMRAADPGSLGNDTQVTITYPTASTFNITVKVTNTYERLTPTTVDAVLGTDSEGYVARRGLAYASWPGSVMPTAGTTAFASGDETTAAGAGMGSSRKLYARKLGSAGNKITATIKDVDATAGTFTLQLVWQDTMTGLDVSTPSAADGSGGDVADHFIYVLSMSPPEGGVYGKPGAGTYVLGGGVDAQVASGFVFTKP